MKKYNTGEEFLNYIYNKMHMEDVVMHSADKSDKPEEKIKKYMDRLEKTHDSERKIELIKSFYYKKYLIKELPENYIAFQQRIARERGYGNIEVTLEMKEDMLREKRENQKQSLDAWIDYLTTVDVAYPMWFKNYVFQGMTKLGKYNKEKGTYTKRTDSTVEPFVEINPEIIANIYTIIRKSIDKEELNEEEEKVLNNGESFRKMYAYFMKEMYNNKNELKETRGEWIKYNQGSDYRPLWESLQGKNTRWCTAGEETAKIHIAKGDFYVYYTYDKEGKATNPRLAIRMEGTQKIAEVRGIGKNQEIEPEMLEIIDKKLDEFKDKENYKKKTRDMKLLTQIDNKVKDNKELTIEELRFLYEINFKIQGFGWTKDPRIKEIKSKRNPKLDYAKIYDVKTEEIALSQEEYLSNPNKYKVLIGSLILNELTSAKGIILPQIIEKNLYLRNLTSTEGLKLPQAIGGHLYLDSLTSAEGLALPQTIGGSLNLSGLTSVEGLVLPPTIGGDLYLDSLTSVEGLALPQIIGGSLNLSSLTSAEGLILPPTIGENLYLNRLTSAEGLVLPSTIGGNIYLSGLTNAEGLVLPQTIGSDLDLRSLTSAKGLVLPQTIGGDLLLSSLTNAEGLVLPQAVGVTLDLSGLTSAKGLVLPKTIGKLLDLSGLTSADGLELPEQFDLDKLFCSFDVKDQIIERMNMNNHEIEQSNKYKK